MRYNWTNSVLNKFFCYILAAALIYFLKILHLDLSYLDLAFFSIQCYCVIAFLLQAYADICKILKTTGATGVRSYLEENDLIKLFPLLDKFVRNELLPQMSRSPLTSHLSTFSSFGQVSG